MGQWLVDMQHTEYLSNACLSECGTKYKIPDRYPEARQNIYQKRGTCKNIDSMCIYYIVITDIIIINILSTLLKVFLLSIIEIIVLNTGYVTKRQGRWHLTANST